MTAREILDMLAELAATQDLRLLLITHSRQATRYLADDVLRFDGSGVPV